MVWVVHDKLQYFQDNWYDFNRLTILSFHNVKGNIILGTISGADLTILLPVLNGNVANCRKKDKKFTSLGFREREPSLSRSQAVKGA